MSDAGLAAVIAAEGGAAEGGDKGATVVATDGGVIVDGGSSQAGDGGEGGAAAEPWYGTLSDEAAAGALSDKAWVANKKYADPAALVKAARELEKQFLGGDKVVLPKDGASEEERNAFYKKIGRPDAADGYVITAPEGKELDEALVAKFRDTAFKAGLPATAAAPLVEMFNAHVEEVQEQEAALKAAAAKDGVTAIKKEWGASAPQNMAAANRAMTMLELTGDDVDAMADALPEKDGKNGTARVLALLSRLGTGMGEDVLGGGGGPRKFGMSGAEAQAKLDAMSADPAIVAKLEAKDPVLTAQRRQLHEIVAAYEDAENRKG